MFAALLLCIGTSGQVQLPESHAARAWAAVGPDTVPVELDQTLLKEDPWLLDIGKAGGKRRWQRWGTWMAAEKDRELADPATRAALVVLAVEDNRWDDAWEHFARLGGAPRWAAALMPHLMPGVSLEHGSLAGGIPAPLAAETVLRPALPPAAPGQMPGSLHHRVASLRGLIIGEGSVDMTITIEPSGVQVDLLHVAGPAVRVGVLLPEPFGRKIRVQYTDWMREEERHGILYVELLPGSEEVNLFGRYDRGRERLPQLPRGALALSLKRGGIWMECETGTALAAEAEPFALALGRVFGMPAGVLAMGASPPVEPWTATICRLQPGLKGHQRLLALAAAAERYALLSER